MLSSGLFFLHFYSFFVQKVVKLFQDKTNVVITNVLGQTIANTVVTSSEATISAPAGYVTVAVEGEAAVKAIVK